MKRITVYTIVLSLISFSMIAAAQDKRFRAIKVINDLSHKSGKIGTYRALIIGINDYKDSRIPDLATPLSRISRFLSSPESRDTRTFFVA